MTTKKQSYKDLVVWQKSVDLVILVYQLTKCFSKDELYSLTSQMRRSAISIPSNIAEGSFRAGKKEFIQFLHIAYGSGAELETQLIITERLQHGDIKDIQAVQITLDEIMRMLNKLIAALKTNN